MKFAPLIIANLLRHRFRLAVVVTLVALAFALFGVALAFQAAFTGGATGIGTERLLVSNKASQGLLMPLRLGEYVSSLPQVKAISHATWFGGYYREAKNPVPLLAVDAATHFTVNTDLKVDPAALRRWQDDRHGLIIGRRIAEKFDVAVGQRFNLSSYLWLQPNGSNDWDFEVSGIYDAADAGAPAYAMFMHYDYLDQSRVLNRSMVNVFYVLLGNGDDGPAVSKLIDDHFQNSEYETQTDNMAALAEGYFSKLMNVNQIALGLIALVLGLTFLISASNVANNVQQRINELASLRAIGYTAFAIVALVLAETLVLFIVGMVIGMATAEGAIAIARESLEGYLPAMSISAGAWGWALIVAVALALLSVAAPASRIRRIDVSRQLQS